MPNLVFLNPSDTIVDVTPELIGEIANKLKEKLRNKFCYLVFVTPLIGNLREKDSSLSYAMGISKSFEYQYKIILLPSNLNEWDNDKERENKTIVGSHREILIFTNGVKPETKMEVKEPVEDSTATVPEPVKEASTATVPKPVVASKPEVKTPVVATVPDKPKETKNKTIMPDTLEALATVKDIRASKNGKKK
jgi:hypothetical protein